MHYKKEYKSIVRLEERRVQRGNSCTTKRKSFWTSLFKNRRRNYFSRRYCRGFFIVPRIVFSFRIPLLLSVDSVIDTSFMRFFFVPREQRNFTNMIGEWVSRSCEFYPWVCFFGCLDILFSSWTPNVFLIFLTSSAVTANDVFIWTISVA